MAEGEDNAAWVTEEEEYGSVPQINSSAEETPSPSGSAVSERLGEAIPALSARATR